MSTRSELKNLEKYIEDEQGLIDSYASLLEHPGWKMLCTVIREQTRLRRNEVLTKDAHGLDGMIDRERDISELSGINTAMSMPAILMDESEMTISGLRDAYDEMLEELQDDDEPPADGSVAP